MTSFMDRVRSSYNVLRFGETAWVDIKPDAHITSSSPSSATYRVTYENTQAVLAPIMSRISIDVANIPLRHVIVDKYDQFLKTRDTELNDRLSIMANIDQSGPVFIQDAVNKLLESGAVALVPVEISSNPKTGGFEILSIRAATISQWFNGSVEVSVYNELTGNIEQKTLPKGYVSIVYNPMYGVMNEPNSTLRRLIDRLAMLDQADGRLFSPQLDLVIQLPYAIKTDRRIEEAERRVDAIEAQMNDRKYGVVYLDATEKVTQLNRPVTNTLADTVAGLTESLHAQLGLTPSIFSGTATQEEMLFYNNRTVLPIVNALCDSMVGNFFTRTAVRQGNRVRGFPNLFKMAPLSEFSDAADKLTRNEIMTSNEIRAVVGLHPSADPEADALRNKNLNKAVEPGMQSNGSTPPTELPPLPTIPKPEINEGVNE